MRLPADAHSIDERVLIRVQERRFPETSTGVEDSCGT